MAKGKYQKWLKSEGLLKIEGWAKKGLSDKQIAYNMGIAYSTLKEWKTKYPAFSATLIRGKDVVDQEVENALEKRCVGCAVREETVNYDEDGNIVSRRVTTKEIPPDTSAIIMWLKNRRPDDWRDKRDIGLSGEVEAKNPFADLTTEELKRIIKDG